VDSRRNPSAAARGAATFVAAMRWLSGTLLVGLYLALALLPLVTGLAPPVPPGRAFWLELSVALGFIAFGQLALQFVLIARFRRVSRPFGIDLVMQYHRQIGILAVLFALAHPLVLVVWEPVYARALDPRAGDWATLSGALAALAMVGLVVLSLRRRPLGLSYEAWRVSHALLGVAALTLVHIHVLLTGPYVEAPWKYAALTAWSTILVGSIVYLRVLKPFELARRPWRVAQIEPEVAGTWSLVVEPDGHGGLAFAPGQFAWIKIGRSPWSVEEHPFSFSSSAERPARLEFGIKELGDFTSGIGRVSVGTRVLLDGPHGSFSCDFHAAERLTFIAGGIGISPILSMLRTLADRNDRRPLALVYACSRWDRVAFRAELAELQRRLALDIVYVLEQGHEGWTGPTGYVTREILEPLLGGGGPGQHVFLCGPDAMMTSVERILLECGLPAKCISMERFHLV
jgi:predicted ferric reductase